MPPSLSSRSQYYLQAFSGSGERNISPKTRRRSKRRGVDVDLMKSAVVTPRNNYSCSPPGVEVGSAPSLRLFLCEPFLPDGLAPVSAEDAELVELVAFSVLLDFFDFFVVGAPPLLAAGDA